MARWLVTGGLGFIGYHLTRALLLRGDDVTVLDDFSPAPYPTRYKERNARDLAAEGGANLRVERGDVCDPRRVGAVLDGVNGVIHLAGLAGVRPSFADPAAYVRVNVEGTAVVLGEAHARGVTRVLFASSSSVYGNATPLPADEDAPAIVPESPYAASKRSAELIAAAMLRRMPSVACTALRFFTVYGPRQRPEMAITLFARAILAGEPIVLFGDGSMRRDFTHVSDIVRGILAAADRTAPGFRAYNLGSGAPVDLVTLVRLLADATGRAPVVTHGETPIGDVDATYASIAKAARDLAWSPTVPLREGLRTVVEWVAAND